MSFVAGVQLSELSKASYLKLSEDVLSHGGLFKWSYFATMSASEDCTDVLRRDGCRLALTATKPFYNEHWCRVSCQILRTKCEICLVGPNFSCTCDACYEMLSIRGKEFCWKCGLKMAPKLHGSQHGTFLSTMCPCQHVWLTARFYACRLKKATEDSSTCGLCFLCLSCLLRCSFFVLQCTNWPCHRPADPAADV